MTTTTRIRAPKASQNVIDDYEMYLSKHPEHVFTAKKGATPTIQQQFKDEYGHERSLEWLRSYLHKYRLKNNVKIQYRDDKYYTSTRKTAALAKQSEVKEMKETQEADQQKTTS